MSEAPTVADRPDTDRPATALVTGTSSGIGFATVLRLLEDGLHVVAGMRNPQRDGAGLLAASRTIGSIDEGALRIVALDVDDDASVAAAFDGIERIDALVNNAGTSPVGSVEEFGIDRWKALFETNLFGAVRCMQAAMARFRTQGHGTIVNISSIAGRVVVPMFGPYSASKYALEAASEALAMEARPFGVRVVLIEPGAVRTPIQQKTTPPPRTSPYPESAKNWGFALGYDHARASDPSLIADEVAAAVREAVTGGAPGARQRPVGQGCRAMIELRERLGDDAWQELWSAPTAEFLERYRALTGIDLRPA